MKSAVRLDWKVSNKNLWQFCCSHQRERRERTLKRAPKAIQTHMTKWRHGWLLIKIQFLPFFPLSYNVVACLSTIFKCVASFLEEEEWQEKEAWKQKLKVIIYVFIMLEGPICCRLSMLFQENFPLDWERRRGKKNIRGWQRVSIANNVIVRMSEKA